MNRSELKKKAKESLKGKYWESIKLFLLYILVAIGLSIFLSFINRISDSSLLLSFILTIITFLGMYGFYGSFYGFFLKISRNEEVTCTELFKNKKLFRISVGATIASSIFSFLGILFFIIPGIIIALSYSMVYFVIADNPEISVMDALTRSREIMNGYKWKYIILNLSFIGWYILCYFTFGLLLLWLAPYIMVTTANFYNEIKEQN